LINISVWKKSWELLDQSEQRNAFIVIGLGIFAAFANALMVASVFPFLSVMADPSNIESNQILIYIYNNIEFKSAYNFLVFLGFICLVLIVISTLLQLLRVYSIERYSRMRMSSISVKLFSNYLQQPYQYFLTRHSGELSTRILSEAHLIVTQFYHPMANLITAFFTIVILIVTLLLIQPRMTIYVLGGVGSVYCVAYIISRRVLGRLGDERAESNVLRFRIVNETLGGIKDLKLLGQEQDYVARFQEPSNKMARAEVAAQVVSQAPTHVIQALAFAAIILLSLVLLNSQDFSDGRALGSALPIMGLLAFAGQRLMPELAKLYQGFSQIQYGAAAVNAVHNDLCAKQSTREHVSKKGSLTSINFASSLRLENVSYQYPSARNAGLKNVSIEINLGERVGIAGGTGAGKTTLADIVLGLLRPTKGEIVVDGTSLSDEFITAWQRNVAYVPQDIYLIDASIAENIAFGYNRAEIDEDRLQHAARIAQLDHFINQELPDGFSTLVGERGVSLSGGQCQRLGIARAMYKNAKFIVFDEATSALDNLTEREVMSAISALPKDTTILIIAHRLSTLQSCDRIFVMDTGEVIDVGDWKSLANRHEIFRLNPKRI
jgi:ABC-type multidrug transport system fused ATPase/permease subunit